MGLGLVAVVALLVIVILSSNASAQTDCNPNTSGGNLYASDQSLTGAAITNDPSTWPGASSEYPDGPCWNICAAIAFAEGYNEGAGYVPYDLNNPGDISDGAATFGSALHSGSQVTTFPTAETGWQYLYSKVEAWRNGTSAVYAGKTWAQVATIYAGNSAAWLNNVTTYLGVDPTSTPTEYQG